MPTASRPSPWLSGLLPTATRSRSHVKASLSFSVSRKTLTFAPFFITLASDTLVLSLKSIPCWVRNRFNVLATCPSRVAAIFGSISITVTLDPKRRQMEPSSRPIYPPPTMPRCLGTVSKDRASVELTMCLPSNSSPGTVTGSLPVAKIMAGASR